MKGKLERNCAMAANTFVHFSVSEEKKNRKQKQSNKKNKNSLENKSNIEVL